MAVVSANHTQFNNGPVEKTNYSAMAMVTTLFFVWGFCTVLNDTLIPRLQVIFGLSYTQASLVQLSFFGSYFLFAQPASKLIERIGYQKTMVVGLLAIGVGSLLVLPAASVASYPFILVAEIVLGAGITALQVSANPYVAILGPPSSSASRLNLTQAFNTLGDTVAPYFGSILILGTAAEAAALPSGEAALNAYRVHQAASIKLPYLLIAGAMVVLALAIALYRFPRLEVTRDFRPGSLDSKQDSIWNHPHLYLGALAIFIYVGAEVSVASYLVKYLAEPEIGNLPLQTGAKLLSLFWLLTALGRFAGSAVMQRFAPNRLLAWAGVGAAVFVGASFLGHGLFSVVTIILVGLFNSIMFPTIFTLAVAELGPLTGRASGILVQGIVGGAAIPVLMGWLADRYGIHHSLFVPFLCYGFVIFYGLRGYRITPTEPHSEIQAV
ncbi:FHS family L-fucose permease-like MFS transporter [Granulicella aggregans]|uniref:FHS family L-fucose permease-like MFS transporter n=1 Tax=Granulicella aggregans TaxID=474949 RepID=A0A7W8E747_9BACT|nr:sugar MFS transporter [Granulicella aggregans]MBB5061024.1 FHS family L-fucose permease-like MFS transporter [Granulicella aggregans]